VRIRRKAPVPEIEDDAIAAFALRPRQLALAADAQIGIAVHGRDDGRVGDGQDRLAECGKAAR